MKILNDRYKTCLFVFCNILTRKFYKFLKLYSLSRVTGFLSLVRILCMCTVNPSTCIINLLFTKPIYYAFCRPDICAYSLDALQNRPPSHWTWLGGHDLLPHQKFPWCTFLACFRLCFFIAINLPIQALATSMFITVLCVYIFYKTARSTWGHYKLNAFWSCSVSAAIKDWQFQLHFWF